MNRSLPLAVLAALLAAPPLFAADAKAPEGKPAEAKQPAPSRKSGGGAQYVVELKVIYNSKSYEERLMTGDAEQVSSVTALADDLVLMFNAIAVPAGDMVGIQAVVSLDERSDKRPLLKREFKVQVKKEAWTAVSSSPAAKIMVRVADAVEGGIPD